MVIKDADLLFAAYREGIFNGQKNFDYQNIFLDKGSFLHYTLKVKIFETHSKIQDVREKAITLQARRMLCIQDPNKTMKNKGEIKMFEKMKELIAEQLNCPAEEIKMESSFKEDLGADSLDLFELVMSLEDTYGVEIPSEELEQLTTVESVVDYLKQKGVEA